MKIILTILLLPLFSFANPGPLDGTWKLSERICSNGDRPRDNINLDRSNYIAEFAGANFKLSGHINGCILGADGFFKLDGKILTLYYVNNSNCNGMLPKGDFTGALFRGENEFSTIASAPATGGACRPAEVLISTFRRTQ